MAKFLAYMAMALGLAAIAVWIIVILIAQNNDWIITLNFNVVGEGVLERNLLIASAIAWFAGFTYLIRTF